MVTELRQPATSTLRKAYPLALQVHLSASARADFRILDLLIFRSSFYIAKMSSKHFVDGWS